MSDSYDPPAVKFGRLLLVSLAVWGSVGGAVWLILLWALPNHPPASAIGVQSTCKPSVSYDPASEADPLTPDPAAPVIRAHSRCDAIHPGLDETNELLHGYLEGAEIAATPHGPQPAVDAELLAKGAGLYVRHCAACHGVAGDGAGPNACAIWGAKPAIHRNGVYELRTTEHEALPVDEDLFRTMTRGVHGTAMPPWFALSERDRWALVAHVKTLSKQFAEDVAPPPIDFGRQPEATSKRIAHGQALYKSGGCASCHGDTGHGDGVAAAVMAIPPRDFTKGHFHRGSTAADIHASIVTGLDGTPMASFAKVMPPDDLWDVSLYVASLAPAMIDRDGLRCPKEPPPLNAEELFGIRNLMHTLHAM